MIVKHVLDIPYLYTLVDDPSGCRKVSPFVRLKHPKWFLYLLIRM